jgi:hypothetical protein
LGQIGKPKRKLGEKFQNCFTLSKARKRRHENLENLERN